MKKILLSLCLFLTGCIYSQTLPELKFHESQNFPGNSSVKPDSKPLYEKVTQLKKRKALNKYVGAGYSFVIFTDGTMNSAYPILDTRTGSFLSGVNVYFGFAIASAVTLEIEPSILFTNNTRLLTFTLNPPVTIGNGTYQYASTGSMSMLAFPIALNARFFPFFKQSNFVRLFFVGGGAGMIWVREENNNYYSNQSGGIYYDGPLVDETTSQWAPLFRTMIGFTGTGGQFGFGGEVRYNIIPLKSTNQPFATRFAKNFNSVDLTVRFYFSL